MIRFSRLFLACIFFAAQLGRVEAAQCSEPDTPPSLSDDDLKTVVVTKEKNPNILDAEAFSLAKTLDNIITTARGHASQPTAADREALLETLLEGLRAKTLSNDEAGVTFTLHPRVSESVLTAKDLLDAQGPHGMQPVGLFNRLDLAPKSLLNCGEHRIVYAKTKVNFSNTQRFFLIFEAALPNPHPTNAVVGCQQVAALWSSLKSLSDDQAKQALLKFYYSGGAIFPGGLYFEPVVDFRHFGLLGAGQVRWNQAPDTSKPWHLRQWNIKLSSEFVGAPVFNAAPINGTPVPAYFGGRAVEVIPMDADKVAKLQASFQNEFLCTNVKQLTSVEADRSGNSVSAQELIAGIGVQVDAKFSAPESVSGDASPTQRAQGSGFSEQVATQIGELELDEAWGLTAEHVLNRMGAMTCGGCHQFSNRITIAPNIKWPPSLRFVHIDEKGCLSELLLSWLLPARADITSKLASGNSSYASSIALAHVLQKSADLRKLLGPAQGRLQELSVQQLSEIEALSIDLRRSFAREPGAFVMFRKPD